MIRKLIFGTLAAIGAIVVALFLLAGVALAANWDEFKCGYDAGMAKDPVDQKLKEAECNLKYGK